MPKDPINGDGWAVTAIGDLGGGPGFRKVRQALDVTEFGVNAVVLPPGYESRRHFHDRQQELYVVMEGQIEFDFDGAKQKLGPGGLARVDAPIVRSPAQHLVLGRGGLPVRGRRRRVRRPRRPCPLARAR